MLAIELEAPPQKACAGNVVLSENIRATMLYSWLPLSQKQNLLAGSHSNKEDDKELKSWMDR